MIALAEEPQFKPGDVVQLVNVRSGLAVVGTNYRGKRLLTPNPTRGVIVGEPRENAAGLPLLDVRLTDGPHRGKLVSCHPNVVRLICRARLKAFRG